MNTTTQMHAVYVYGSTGRIAKKVSDIAEYYHTDHLGSTRLVTTEDGAVTEEVQYEPFGEEIGTPEERYTYNGKEKDETGLYYYGARYYDPQIGRFLTRDVVKGDYKVPQDLNRYTYCRNNPLLYTDPDGRMEKKRAIDGSKSSHPYQVNSTGFLNTLLLDFPVTAEKGFVEASVILIKYYDSQSVKAAESTGSGPLGVSGTVNIFTLQVECNGKMMEQNISITTEGTFELSIVQGEEGEQFMKVQVKVVPQSEGEVTVEFSFVILSEDGETEIKITLFPTTTSLLSNQNQEIFESWSYTIPAGSGPTIT